MSARPPRAEDTLGAEGEAEWERLSRQVELAGGFWLGFVFVPSARVAGVLRERLEAKLAEEGQSVHVIRPAAPFRMKSVVQMLLERGTKAGVGCTWLEAVHTDVVTAKDRPWESAWREMLLRANEQRDALRMSLRHGLVFVAPPNVKPLARELAPDLWHVRTLVSGIAAEPAPLHNEDSVIIQLPRALSRVSKRANTLMSLHQPPAKAALARPDPPSSQPGRKRPSERPPADDRARRVSEALQIVAEAERALDDQEPRRALALALRAAASIAGIDPLVESRAWMVAAIARAGERDPAAADAVEKAISVRRGVDPEAVPVAWLVVKASVLIDLDRTTEARKALVDAYRTARDRHRRNPNLETAMDLADVLCWTGEMLLAEDATRATMALEEAHRLLAQEDLTQDAALSRRNLETLLRLGDAYRQLGRDADAEAVFALGAATAVERASQASADAAALRDASVLLNRLGTIQLTSGESSDAIQSFERAAELRRGILALHPHEGAGTTTAAAELISALEKLASALRAARRDADARRTEDEAESLRGRAR